MPTVLISSVNYSGQTADITFNPQTGGTINIGSLVIPYYYTADYVYGFYSLFFSAFNSTCTYEILSPTPTPTQTSTRTPTQTSTQTPTQTPTQTMTMTPTQTMTMTPTQTMTMTPTQTMTMTPTPTRFPACVDCEMSGVSFSTVCYGCYPIAFGKNTKVNSTSYSVVMTFDGGVNYNYTTTFSPYNKFTNITRGYLGSTSVYFFIADGTTVFYSENGYDWTNAGSVFPDNATFTSFGQDNNDNFIWLVYSEDTTTSIFYSTNLTTWTQATISNPQTDGWCDFLGVRENSSIAYGWDNSSDRLWVQVGRSGGSFDQAISYDGYNWTGINTGIDCNFVSFGNGVWVKVKTGNLTQPFYYSYDGINWTLMSTTFASNKAVQCLNFGNNRFVAAVRTQFTNVLEIYYSDNGITWTLGSLYPSTVTGSLSQIQYDSQNNRWYVVGNTSVSFAFYSTDNGVTWTDSSPNDALNNSQFDVDACEVLIPTPAPTRSLTPSQTPTNTLTPSPTITPINECLVIYNTGNIANPIYSYNPSNNQSTLLPIPSPGAVTTPNDVAHTSTKLWLNYDTTLQTSVALREWDITLNPWTATFNQDIVLWYGGNSAGLFAVSNNLLILVRKGAPQRVYELDPSQPIVNPTNPVFKFNLPLGYSVAGDYLLTTTNKLLLTMNGPSSGRFLVQIDYSTGLEDFPPIQIGDGTTGLTSPYGIYEWQSNIYIINNNGETSGITTSSPYTLSPFNDIGLNVNGASQISNCLDINLISVSPTPTPTPTNTPSQSITPSITSSVTPTRTVTPTRSVTPTRTVTPTRVTPTPTRTITPTRTLTPTVTPTDYPCNCFAFTSSDPFNSGAVNLYDCRQRLTQLKVSFGMTQYACGFIVSLSPWVSSIAYSAQCATQSTTSIPPGCCLCYQLTFTAGTAPYVFGAPEKYTNCAGQEVSFTASTVGPHYICANSQDKYIQASLGGDFSGFSLSILSGCDSGVCLGITRTPTPTPTRTPTPTLTLTRTPTPTPTVTPTSGATSLCNCITLANTGTTNDGYSYIDCDSTLISDSIDVGFIKSFCAQSIITESEQSQMVTGSTCSVDGDCSNCVCITFTNNTGGQGTYGYRDCDGVTQGPFTIEDGESIQVCGFRVDTGSLSKNIRWSIGGVCEDGVTCPFVLTSESILLWDDINQLVYLYDHLNNTITDIGLVDILGVSPDIARNQSHIWMYELIDSENTTFRQWDITSTNPFSAPTYTDYSITAGTYNGLTVYNSTDTVFAMSSDTVSILRITMSTGNVVKANDFSDVLVSDFIYNPSDNLLIIAGQDTITNNHRILQFDGGGLTGYHNNGGTPIVALYQYGSQLFYIEENFDVYQIDLTSPYTTTYIQTIPGLGRLAGAAQDDPNVITVMFT